MAPYYADDGLTLHHGDALDVLRTLPDGSVNSCVTSPPYFGLRDYGEEGQYGLEASPAEYVETMRTLFTEVRRVLADDGTLWLNLGDSYSTPTKGTLGGVAKSTLGAASGGHAISPEGIARSVQRQSSGKARRIDAGVPEKNLLGIPWRVAFALQDDGWILRNAIVWKKTNPMPSSVTDRLNNVYEHVFMFSKSSRYWFDLDPIREPLAHPEAADGTRVFGGKLSGEGKIGSSYRTAGGMPNTYGRRSDETWTNGMPRTAEDARSATGAASSAQTDSGIRGRNPGDVWTIATQPFTEAHFAVMTAELAERCVLAGCKPGGTVLDPFSGSGTTGMVAQRHGRKYVGIDLNADYLDLSLRTRLQQAALDFAPTLAGPYTDPEDAQ